MRKTVGNDTMMNDGLLNDGVLTGQVFGEKKITKNRQRCYFCLFPILYLSSSYLLFYLGKYLAESENVFIMMDLINHKS